MNVAHQHVALLAEAIELVGELREDALGLGGVGDHVLAHVDDGCAHANVVGSDHRGTAHGHNDDVGAADDFGKIFRFRVADGHGGIRMHQQEGHRLADDVAAAHDHGVGALDRDIAATENFHHAERRAGHQIRPASHQFTHVDRMKAVNVLFGDHPVENFLGVHLRGKRHLHQNAVHVILAVETVHDREQFLGRDPKPEG